MTNNYFLSALITMLFFSVAASENSSTASSHLTPSAHDTTSDSETSDSDIDKELAQEYGTGRRGNQRSTLTAPPKLEYVRLCTRKPKKKGNIHKTNQ